MVAELNTKMDTIIMPTDPSTAPNYALWRKDIVIWQKLTNLPKEKHGLALQYACKLDLKVHERVANIDLTEVEADTGFETVLEILDQLYNFDEKDEEIITYDKFQILSRREDQDILDFINEFDFLVKKLQKYGNIFCSQHLGLKLLNAANLNATECEIIKAFSKDSEYDSIKSTIMRTFRTTNNSDQKPEVE